MYTLPQYSTQPENWSPLPEYDQVNFHMENEALDEAPKTKAKVKAPVTYS